MKTMIAIGKTASLSSPATMTSPTMTVTRTASMTTRSWTDPRMRSYNSQRQLRLATPQMRTRKCEASSRRLSCSTVMLLHPWLSPPMTVTMMIQKLSRKMRYLTSLQRTMSMILHLPTMASMIGMKMDLLRRRTLLSQERSS